MARAPLVSFAATLEQVGLPQSALKLRPGEFSGGQRQRIAIARTLVLGPDLLILDEAVSALDVSIRAQVINLFRKLQRDMGLSHLFISHDLSVVHHIADRVAVMCLGKVVEIGRCDLLFRIRAHPYTRSWISVIPQADPHKRGVRTQIMLKGDLPSPWTSHQAAALGRAASALSRSAPRRSRR